MSIFFPKNHHLNALYLDVGAVVIEMSELFLEAIHHLDKIDHYANRAAEIEGKADNVVHSILTELQTAFITPYDRDDLLSLAIHIDDIVDALEEIIQIFQMYEVTELVGSTALFGECYIQAAKKVSDLLSGCFAKKVAPLSQIQRDIVELHTFEKEWDALYKENMTRLFHAEKDPITVFKHHTIITEMENAMDQFDHISHIIESIRLKSN